MTYSQARTNIAATSVSQSAGLHKVRNEFILKRSATDAKTIAIAADISGCVVSPGVIIPNEPEEHAIELASEEVVWKLANK